MKQTTKIVTVIVTTLFAVCVIINVLLIAALITANWTDCALYSYAENCIELFYNTYNATISLILGVLSVIFTIIEFKINPKNHENFDYGRLIFKIGVLIFLVALPISTSYKGHIKIEENRETKQSLEEGSTWVNESDNKMSTNEQTQKSLSFEFSLDDVLCLKLTTDELEKSRSTIKMNIDVLLKTATLSNTESNRPAYESEIANVEQYEDTYNYIAKNKYFTDEYKQVRIDMLDNGIQTRISANEKYKTSGNQRQISLRFIELAGEYRNNSSPDDALDAYRDAIIWGIYAIQTSVNEENPDSRELMFDHIIDAYSSINDVTKEDSSESKNAKVLKEIFIELKNSI